jgi:hypothetical protein
MNKIDFTVSDLIAGYVTNFYQEKEVFELETTDKSNTRVLALSGIISLHRSFPIASIRRFESAPGLLAIWQISD